MNRNTQRKILFFAVLFSCYLGATAQTVSSLTGNNTAACPSSGPLPVYCQQPFTGQIDPRSQTQPVATPEFNRPAGNVSDEDIHRDLNLGSNTKIYANFMLAFWTAGSGPICNSNVKPGYNSDDSNTIAAQIEDLRRRHLDGAIMTWEGAKTSEDDATLKFQSYVQAHHCSGPQACDPMYFIMYDGPSLTFDVFSLDPPNLSGAGCSTTALSGAAYEQCVITHMKNDMCYMNGTHWGNDAYQKFHGRPVLQVFPNEGVIPATAPPGSPSWADVWAAIESWDQNLQGNCPNNFNGNNGIPLIIFENVGGFTHPDSSGSFYWIAPAGTDVVSNQMIDNIAPPGSQQGITLNEFYQTALGNSSELVWGAAYKGFNSSLATWSPNRIMDQKCGQVWVNSLKESNQFYGIESNPTALPFLQIVTWNDYNEGTEIESGIDNCYTVSAAVDQQNATLTWTLNPTNSTLASLTTVAQIEIYDSLNGGNLSLLTAPLPPAASGIFSLAGLSHGSHQIYVRMVGKNSILNRLSPMASFQN